MCCRPLQDMSSGRLCLYMKGADSVMSKLVHYSDWLEEEVRWQLAGQAGGGSVSSPLPLPDHSAAQEGLRILIMRKKVLSETTYI